MALPALAGRDDLVDAIGRERGDEAVDVPAVLGDRVADPQALDLPELGGVERPCQPGLDRLLAHGAILPRRTIAAVMSDGVMVDVREVDMRGRPGLWVTTRTDAADEAAYDAQFDALETVLAERGLRPDDAVRSRLTAASRPGRDAGSRARLRRQAVPFRVVTSSYVDGAAFAGDGAMLETLVVEGASAGKLAAPHAPSPPPWRVVATGELAFFSGITSFAEALDDQLAEMRVLVGGALALAGELTGRQVQPVAAATYVQRELDVEAMGDLRDRLDLGDIPLRVARCDGFSFPSKLVEVEIDALLGSGA